MIIIDQKDTYLTQVDKLTHYRRFDVPRGRQLKRVVEFSHSIDSLRHPVIQLSDLVIYTTRKFLECDNDYRPNWTAEARNFFASCYDRVQKRMWRTNLIDVEGEEEQEAHALLKLCQSTHNGSGSATTRLPNGSSALLEPISKLRAGAPGMYGLSTDVVRLTDEYEQRQQRSVA